MIGSPSRLKQVTQRVPFKPVKCSLGHVDEFSRRMTGSALMCLHGLDVDYVSPRLIVMKSESKIHTWILWID